MASVTLQVSDMLNTLEKEDYEMAIFFAIIEMKKLL